MLWRQGSRLLVSCIALLFFATAPPAYTKPLPAPLSTDGARIISVDGAEVRLQGVNWFGLEGPSLAPHGLWARNLDDMLRQIAELGFNTIRLPICGAVLRAAARDVSSISFSRNPDLKDKSPLQILDAVVAAAGAQKLKIILDYHSIEPTPDGRTDGRWYDASRSEQDWIDDWVALAQRYRSDPTIIGADLYNEPEGNWGAGGVRDWRRAATEAGNAILRAAPQWLVVVQGLRVYDDRWYWFGGQLQGVADKPIELDRPAQLVYSAHDYPPSLHAQVWFADPDYPANLDGVWDQFWGFIEARGIAPVLLGEFGSRLETEADRQWADAMARYLKKRGIDWVWWSWNANGEPKGILGEDWTTPVPRRAQYLQELMRATRSTAATPRYGYIDCFKDRGASATLAGHDLDGRRLDDTVSMTIGRCARACRTAGLAHFALQNGYSCYCGADYGAFGKAANCTVACRGDPSQICGGNRANSVHRLL